MKKIYKVRGLDCPSCALMLESDLEDAGLVVKCNYTDSTLEASEENLEAAIPFLEKSGISLEQ